MRYLPLNSEDRADMLARVGVASIDALFADIPAGQTARSRSRSAAAQDRNGGGAAARLGSRQKMWRRARCRFLLAQGAYKHHVPASVDHLIQRSEFLTSYTPYQPEIAQGTLQTIFEFQTQVAALTAMDVANASMYDGSTATVEAVAMAHRITKRRKAILSGGLHPHYAEAVRTYSAMAGDETVGACARCFRGRGSLRLVDEANILRRRAKPGCLRQSPRSFRRRRDLQGKGRAACRGVHRGCLARPRPAAGRDGRRYCRGRRPVDRQSLEFRRSLCRALRRQGQIFAPDAGAPLRRNRRCRGTPRLRPDPFDARTAYQARQGDVEHLHQFRSLPASPSRFI